MPRISLKERTARLASYNFFTVLINIKNTSVSQLYQPPRTPFSQNVYHLLLSTCEYCKVLKNSFFIEHHQKQSFAGVLQNRCSEKFRKLHRKALVLESLFKELAGWSPATLLKKDSSTGVFLWSFSKTFKNTFLYGTPPVIPAAPPVAASVFY